MRCSVLTHLLIADPLPTASCHASTVLQTADGRVLVAWFGGSAEGARDVGIYLCEGIDGHFSAPRLMAASEEPHWNPVLFAIDPETIALYYKVGVTIPFWRTMVRISRDGGRSFGDARELVPGDAGGRGPVRSKPIRLRSGRILAPASLEDGHWRAFADRSDDDGRTWQPSNEIFPAEIGTKDAAKTHRGVIQPALWQSNDGAVHMLLRSTEGFIYRADSEDDGATFTAAYRTELPNNNSGIDLARLAGGTLLLALNPTQGNWGARSPLSLYASRDDGATWQPLMDLETEEGEFSYPAVIAAGDDEVLITYTYRRENIALWRIRVTEGFYG